MTKKRILLGCLLLAAVLLGDLCIWRHDVSVDTVQVQVQIPILADTAGDATIYWLTGTQDPETDFAATQARGAHYDAADEVQTVTLQMPAGATWLRVDPIAADTPVGMGQPAVTADGSTIVCTLDIADAWREHGITSAGEAAGTITLITPDGDDPYYIWQLPTDAVLAAASEAKNTVYTVIKILAILAWTGLLALLWRKWDALSEIPREIVQNKRLIANLAKNDFKTKFAGSILGIVWAFVSPSLPWSSTGSYFKKP